MSVSLVGIRRSLPLSTDYSVLAARYTDVVFAVLTSYWLANQCEFYITSHALSLIKLLDFSRVRQIIKMTEMRIIENYEAYFFKILELIFNAEILGAATLAAQYNLRV